MNYKVSQYYNPDYDMVYHVTLDADHARAQFNEIFTWLSESLPNEKTVLDIGWVNDFKVKLRTHEQVTEFVLRFG